MFEVTEAEIKEALSGGKPEFKDKEEVHFTITEVEEKTSDKGPKECYVIKTIIANGNNEGKKYTFWMDRNIEFKGVLLTRMVLACNKPEDVIGKKQPLPPLLIGKTLKSVNRKSGNWDNFEKFSEVSNVPSTGGFVPDTSNIPF